MGDLSRKAFEDLEEEAWCGACNASLAKYLMHASANRGPVPVCRVCAHMIAMHGATLETVADVDDCECPDKVVCLATNADEEGN